MGNSAGEVTLLLNELERGDKQAAAKLVPLVYDELHRLAGHYMRGERPGHTLQPTALINEAFLRLSGQTRTDWQSRAHFIGVAAQMMRRILVDHALGRRAAKRTPAGIESVERDAPQYQTEEILAVDRAVERLAELDEQQGRIVELRYFGGLTVEETAEALGVSPRTVKREWATAKLWLTAELCGDGSNDR